MRKTSSLVAVKSPYLHSLVSSLKICDCREQAVLIFPQDDQDFNSLKFVFKSRGWSVVKTLRARLGIEEEEETGGKSNREQEQDRKHKEIKECDNSAEEIGDQRDDIRNGGVQGGYNQSESMEQDDEDFYSDKELTSKPAKEEEDTEDIDTEDTNNTDEADPYQCGLCKDRSFPTRCRLYVHYSGSHFSTNLKQFIKKQECKICGFTNPNKSHLVKHVGAIHDMVEEFLDKSLHIPRKRGWFNYKKKDCQSQSNNSKIYICKLCSKPRNFASRLSLYRHYSLCHFKEEIKQFIDEDQKQCNICVVKTSQLHHLISHVGCSHNKVDEHLDERLQVPREHRSRSQKKSLSKTKNSKPTATEENMNPDKMHNKPRD